MSELGISERVGEILETGLAPLIKMTKIGKGTITKLIELSSMNTHRITTTSDSALSFNAGLCHYRVVSIFFSIST